MSDEPNASEPSVEERERAERIAELEARLRRPAGVGVLPPVAALALAGALGLLASIWTDVAYFFSEREPVDLGVEGDYRFEAARANRYAQIRGLPSLRGAYWQEHGDTFVAVALLDTPVLVRRRALATERWQPGTTPPRPDQRPFSVRGRLLDRASASRWESAFVQHEAFGQVQPRWLLDAEARPGEDLGSAALAAGLAVFAAINLWLLGRGVVALVARRRS